VNGETWRSALSQDRNSSTQESREEGPGGSGFGMRKEDSGYTAEAKIALGDH
jgi:hypothetical protein